MTRFEKLPFHASSSLQPGPSLLQQVKGMLAMPVFVWILLLWAIMLVFMMMFRDAEKEPLTLEERLWRNGGFAVGVLFLALIYFFQSLEPKELGEGVSCLGTALFFTMALGLTWMNGCDMWRARCRHRIDFWKEGGNSYLAGFAMLMFLLVALVFIMHQQAQHVPFRGGGSILFKLFLYLNGFGLAVVAYFGSLFWVRSAAFARSNARMLREEDEPSQDSASRSSKPSAASRNELAHMEATIARCEEDAALTDELQGLASKPMIPFALMAVGLTSLIDDWHWTTGLIMFAALVGLMIVAPPLLAAGAMTRLRNLLLMRLRAVRKEKATDDKVKALRERITELNVGCFAPISSQPVFQIPALILGGSGVATLAQYLTLQ